MYLANLAYRKRHKNAPIAEPRLKMGNAKVVVSIHPCEIRYVPAISQKGICIGFKKPSIMPYLMLSLLE
jgi:hypothetical protein